jgi:hypothetical protein
MKDPVRMSPHDLKRASKVSRGGDIYRQTGIRTHMRFWQPPKAGKFTLGFRIVRNK